MAPLLYDDIVRLRGWSVDLFRKWTGGTLRDALFG
jgi:hypothetical protein